MRSRIVISAVIIAALAAVPMPGSKVDRLDLESTHIAVGEVTAVDGNFGLNEAGEQLIFSRISLRVEKWLKGSPEAAVAFSVEGGVVGDLGLMVSDSPVFEKGEKIKAYLKKTPKGFELLDKQEVGQKAKKPRPPEPPACCATFAHWPTTAVPYLLNTGNDDGNTQAQVEGAVASGLRAWSVINWQFGGGTTTTRVALNGLNEIFFADESKGSAIAVTYTWYNTSTRHISEFDMKFYDKAWLFFAFGCQGGFNIDNITTHESGHAIGLNHNSCTTSIMYPYASYCANNKVSSDDMACVHGLY
jgi:hypothetical protein